MIVDDSIACLKLLADILKSQGYQVRPASNGTLALRSVAVERPDLILLDVRMPDMNGYELCARLKMDVRNSGIPVIFISALDETEDKVRGFSAGGVDYITKPFEPAEILARVETHLRLHELNENLEMKVTEATEALVQLNQQLRQKMLDQQRSEETIRTSLREKELLLKEIHHRVKNNLQMISSLLDLQSDAITDDRFPRFLRANQDRIRSMALIHERLYKSSDLTSIDMRGYIESLMSFLSGSFKENANRVRFRIDVDDVALAIDTAIPCGLIINELVSNAVKYAFPGQRKGEIAIQLHYEEEGRIRLSISDDGIGLPPAMERRNADTLGLQLVDMLIKQLHGDWEMVQHHGVSFHIRFAF